MPSLQNHRSTSRHIPLLNMQMKPLSLDSVSFFMIHVMSFFFCSFMYLISILFFIDCIAVVLLNRNFQLLRSIKQHVLETLNFVSFFPALLFISIFNELKALSLKFFDGVHAVVLFVVLASNTKFEFKVIAETSFGYFVNGSTTVHCTTSLQEISEKGKGFISFLFQCLGKTLLAF